MRNATVVTAVVAVLAMFAATTQAALVDEDFSTNPNWTSEGMVTGQSEFGWEVGAGNSGKEAITGKWKRNSTTSRYYTGIVTTLDQDSTFTFSFDITAVGARDGSSTHAMVGLMNSTAGTNNRTNAFWADLYYHNDTTVRIIARRYTSTGGGVGEDVFDWDPADGDLHCEFQYDGAGNLDAYAWTGDTKPDDPQYSDSGWGGTWTVNAFGTGNYDDGSKGKMDVTVDDMYLVPEPATMALLSIGGIGVLIRRKRR